MIRNPVATLVLAAAAAAAPIGGGPRAATAQAAPSPPADAERIDTLALRAHTFFLSHDLLLGRGTGTAGEHIAAAYLRSQLLELGVEGGASDGSYLQDVPLVRAVVDTVSSRLTLLREGDTLAFAMPRDFVINTGGAGAFRDFAGEAVFVGTPDDALNVPASSLSGRVPVVVGPLGGAAARLIPDWKAAGVAGVVLLIADPERFALYARSRGQARFFVDAPLDEPIWQPELPVLLAGPDMAAALLDDPRPPAPGHPLGIEVGATLRVSEDPIRAANVLGLIRGSDPARHDEVVVFTAHYDHLGISTPDAEGDSIYNGFSDNAAGAAMLLEIARAFVEAPPARSVLFAFVTGEERGLLGSSYLVASPPVPLQRMIGVINLDAGAPPAPPVSWRIAGGTVSWLGGLAATVAAAHGWAADLSDPSPNSDYWPFLVRGVPAVFLIPGDTWEGVDAAGRDRLRTRWDRYHEASDEWAPDFPFAGLARYARYALELGKRLADAPAR